MRTRKSIVYIAFTVVLILVSELLAYATILVANPLLDEPIRTTRDIYREQTELVSRWLDAQGRGRDAVDGTLGWKYRRNFRNAGNAINSQGLRGHKVYPVEAVPGVLRVAAFGDSFVYGSEVVDADAWASVVENAFPAVELLNYGVGGYGLDQALLRYEAEGAALSPRIVLVCFVVDDVRRLVNVYQRFSSTLSGAFTKPRFRLDAQGQLELLPSPIQDLQDWRPFLEQPDLVTAWGELDQWYEPSVYESPLYDVSAVTRLLTTVWTRLDNRYLDRNRIYEGGVFNASAEAFSLQMAVFDRFERSIRAAGAQAVILFLPTRGVLYTASQEQQPAYAPILERLRASNTPYWDATEAFLPAIAATGMGGLFEPGGHYSPRGNRVVAEWLGPKLLALQGNASP
jgi:hypothetical protein